MTPREYKSAGKLYPFYEKISGAIYYGVPIIVNVLDLTPVFSLIIFAVPKSIILRYP